MTDTAETTDTTAEVLIVTDAARETVFEIRAKEDDAEALGLRVAVTGASGVDYTYDLSLEPGDRIQVRPPDSNAVQTGHSGNDEYTWGELHGNIV